MRSLGSAWLVLLAAGIAVVLFWFRPGGVSGPRPEPVPVEGKGFEHSAFTKVLQAVVGADGRVDYAALRADPGPLDHYLGQLRAVGPGNAPHRFKTHDDRLAYYLNAYNAFMLAAVRDHCPITDVQSVYPGGGLFWRISFLIGEEEVTLSALESELIRGVMQRTPAAHFALIKAAKGFPPLPREAFESSTLHAQLDALVKNALTLPQIAHREGDVLKLSELFNWYAADFDPPEKEWLRARVPALVEGDPRVEYPPFDWSLNGDCGTGG
ncbi:MAG: DUF547 domain-containing protein [Myxococcales bacterium]|nr:DUF547 domain-containing protein [Myxococcales bacterium]